MSYYARLTELQWHEFQKTVYETRLLETIIDQIITIENMPHKAKTTWNKVTTVGTWGDLWTQAVHASPDQSSVAFTPTDELVYRLQRVMMIPVEELRISQTYSDPIDKTLVQQTARILTKELEKFVYRGPVINGTALSTEGLFDRAGQTSTIVSPLFGADTGPYETVRDMKGKLNAQGFGYGKLDLISDTTLFPYFERMNSSYPINTEKTLIERELLNGGKIYVSDGLPAASSNDGVLLLVENKPTNYKMMSPKRLGLSDREDWVYDPRTDTLMGRIEGFYALQVMQPNSICKHVTVDIV